MSKVKTALNLLKRDPKKIFSAFGRNGAFNWMPDKLYLQILYYCETGKKLNLQNPETYNEKLQWLKLYDRRPEYVTNVDKYAVREYIKQTIGEEYLIPLICVYENVEDISWSGLPDKFVLKCTHGSGCNIICKDRSTLNIREAENNLINWMKYNYYYSGREWPYKNVKPRIICENFISDNNETPDDYKVMCFHGKAKLIEIHFNRFGDDHKQDFYDISWSKTEISQSSAGLPRSQIALPKPVYFEEMIRLSEILAKDKYHVRIDWYIVKDKLYFGEITFFDASGFTLFDNLEDDRMIGSWINLNMK